MPKRITTIGEVDPRLADRYVHAVQFQRSQEGHLDVDIILPELVDQFRFPGGHLIFRNNLALVVKFCRPAPADAGHLPDPAGLHLVRVILNGDPANRRLAESIRLAAGNIYQPQANRED